MLLFGNDILSPGGGPYTLRPPPYGGYPYLGALPPPVSPP